MNGNIVLTGLLLFIFRIVDVSLGTIKLKAVVQGKRFIAPVIAFIEILVYTLTASVAYQYVNNKFVLMLYCLGYATGYYIGIIIDSKLIQEDVFVILSGIKSDDMIVLADSLRKEGLSVITEKGYGLNGVPKLQLKIILNKCKLAMLEEKIAKYDINEVVMSVLPLHDVKAYI
ncbi:MAG: DUF5698 domain-containing protein [Candidatus Anstonellales archaeon]